MEFEREFARFKELHENKRTGERLRRLKEGLGHAEKLFLEQVWWPVVGHFDHLHPEYEVKDFQDGSRFIDFAYIRQPYRICFEMDGYGPHMRDMDRWKFGDNLIRQNHLILDDWKLFRFSYDDINQKQRRCQQFLMHIMGRYFGDRSLSIPLTKREKDIVRYAALSIGPFCPKSVAEHLDIRVEHTRRWLHRLLEKGILRSVDGQQRMRTYELTAIGKRLLL